MNQYYRVHAVIDLDAICHNIQEVKRVVGEGVKVMPVIKADGYGHGAVPIAKELNKIGVDARCGENSNSLYFQCSGNVGCKNSGDFYLHPSSWTGTCVCLGMHDRSQYASFCFIHFTLFQRQMEPYE